MQFEVPEGNSTNGLFTTGADRSPSASGPLQISPTQTAVKDFNIVVGRFGDVLGQGTDEDQLAAAKAVEEAFRAVERLDRTEIPAEQEASTKRDSALSRMGMPGKGIARVDHMVYGAYVIPPARDAISRYLAKYD